MSTLIDRFDVTKNYVIEASAGTGKTYNIVKIVEKLLDHGVDLQKMLIVTYTDKAAGELKDRIRKAVGDRNVNVDEASIGTIHSFCQKAIEEFCISSGKSSSLEKIDEDEVDDCIRRYIRKENVYPEICRLKIMSLKDKDIKCDEGKIVNTACEAVKSYYLNALYKEDRDIAIFDRMEGEKERWLCYDEMVLNGRDISDVFSKELKSLDTLEKSTDNRAQEFAQTVRRSLSSQKKIVFDGRSYQERYFHNPDDKIAFNIINTHKNKAQADT